MLCRRGKEGVRNNMRITEKTIEILREIGEFKYLPVKLLVEIVEIKGIYANWQYVYLVVKNLEEDGLLRSYSLGVNSKILALTKKGARILGDLPNLSSQIHAPKTSQIWKYANVAHTIKLVEIYISLLKVLKNRFEIELIAWNGDHQQVFDYSYRSIGKSKLVRKNLIPDSLFLLRKSDLRQWFFLEYDSGTMDRVQLRTKFTRYFEYFVYGKWKDNFDQFPAILFLTERSEKSLLNLVKDDLPYLASQLSDRTNLSSHKNVIVQGVSASENIKSIPTQKLQDYFAGKFYFLNLKSGWEKEFLKQV